jgi:hypothetical protein
MQVMAGKGPLNWTTKIRAKVTAQECVGMLVDHGAERAGLTVKDRRPVGIEFQISTKWGLRHYALPVDVDASQALLFQAIDEGRIVPGGGGRTRAQLTSREHAEDVAWRVMRDWLEVQIAMIEAGLATMERLLLSWQLVAPGQDMFDALDEQQLQLPAARS